MLPMGSLSKKHVNSIFQLLLHGASNELWDVQSDIQRSQLVTEVLAHTENDRKCSDFELE